MAGRPNDIVDDFVTIRALDAIYICNVKSHSRRYRSVATCDMASSPLRSSLLLFPDLLASIESLYL